MKQFKPSVSFAAVAVAVGIFLISGCGTLFLSKSKDTQLISNPVDARVTIDGTLVGITPMEISLPTNKSHLITFSKDGYESVGCTINRKVSGVIVVLDVLSGLVPVIIDAATGGWYKLDGDSCTVVLPAQ